MSRVFFFPAARDDLEAIAFYIAEDNPRRALQFKNQLEEKALSLAHYALRAPLAPEAGPDIRRLIHGNYIIYYRAMNKDDTVFILRILHAGRDISILEI